MTAIRIIDSHLELADIGTNSHAQIDTHIAAADDYVKRDGSLALTSDWDIGDTRKILADEIRARDGAGLKLYDDGGSGIFVEDGGDVGIGTDSPETSLQVGNYGSSEAITLAMSGNTEGRINFYDFSNVQGAAIRVIGGGAGAKMYFANYWNVDSNRVTFDLVNGNVGIVTDSPTAKLDINSDIFRLRTAKTPATAGAAGNQGDWCWDATHIYVCTATNTWKRAAIAAW